MYLIIRDYIPQTLVDAKQGGFRDENKISPGLTSSKQDTVIQIKLIAMQ